MQKEYINTDISTTNDTASPLKPEPDDYCHHLNEYDLTEDQQNELLQSLWYIMGTLVDIGWGVDTVQMLLPELFAEVAPDSQKLVESKGIPQFDQVVDIKEGKKRMTNIPIINTSTQALIYCRVSDTKQKIEGNGLESQEFRCRQYATEKNYDVDKVFHDDVSGGGDFAKRPGMIALLSYLENNQKTDYVVIFDDLKRLARDTMFHWQLRHAMANFGARLECLNYTFDDSPEGEFVETLFAAQGQL